MDYNIKLLKQKKEEILPELLEWAETFNPENMLYNSNIDEDDEIVLNDNYEIVVNLFTKFENNSCSEKDFEDILFHIEQINYNEEKIRL